MIDGLKILNVIADIEKLIHHPQLINLWRIDANRQNGDIGKDYIDYRGLRFIIKGCVIQLKGSIHKYCNFGKHNFNDFGYSQIVEVLNEFEKSFEINLNRTRANNLEFGVNVLLPYKTSLLLDNLLTYKGNVFERVVDVGMEYYELRHPQFIIKIYNKGKQYNLQSNILRFEIRVIKMQYFERYKIPISNLSDLKNPNVYPLLSEVLINTFKEILFSDNRIDPSKMTLSEKAIFYKGSNPNCWIGKSKTEKEKKQKQRFKKKYCNLLNKYREGEDFYNIALVEIIKKCLKLSPFYQSNIIRDSQDIIENSQRIISNKSVPNLHFNYKVETGQQP